MAARLEPGRGRPGQRDRRQRLGGSARARGARGRRARHDHPPRAPRPAADRRVEPFPAVMAVDAHADFPHGLRIVVHEHVAVAALAAGHRSRARGRRRHPAARQLDQRPAGRRRRGAAARGHARRPGAPCAPWRCWPPRRPSCAPRSAASTRGPAGSPRRWRRARSCTSAAPTACAAKWAAAARVLADRSSSGATYVDLRLPERPAAGGLVAPAPPAARARPRRSAPQPAQPQTQPVGP